MTTLDWLVVAGYGVTILLLGILVSGRSENDTDYFLAGRKEGWAPVAGSTWATKLSGLTFIGVPGAAIAGNFAYAQLWIGSFLAAYFIATLLIPEFYRLRVSTVYEYLGLRVGPRTRTAGTIIFILSRCLASAVRLAGCAIAVSVFFELALVDAILLIAGVAAAYVLTGGLRAVIWTDVLQLILFLTGAAAAIAFVSWTLPGGAAQIIETGMAANKYQVFDFRFDLADPTTFWIGNLFAFVLGLATGGADQDIAQRALACPNAKQARIAVVTAGAADLLSTLLFLSAGAAVFAYYEALPQEAVTKLMADKRFDYVFPHFILHELPSGLRGLLVAALLAAAMSSLDSALSGLSSSAYFDLGVARAADQRKASRGPRLLVVAFATLLASIAIGFGSQPSILWFGLQIMGYTYGGLLGLFIAARCFPAASNDTASVLAAASSIAVVVLLTQWGIGFGFSPVPWPWGVIIGATWTCVVIQLANGLRRRVWHA